MHKIKKTKLGLMVALALGSSAAQAEWTAATDDHKLINNEAGIAHITSRDTGGHYVSYTREFEGMDVYLQSLDAKGNILWEQENLIFDRNMSYAFDYGLVALSNGSARMAIRNVQGGEWNEEIGDYDPTFEDIHLFEINEEGVSRWPEGLKVNSDADTIAMGTPNIYAVGEQSIVTWDQSFDDGDDDMYDNGNTVARVALFNEAGEQVWVAEHASGEFASISDTYIAHDGVVVVYFQADEEALKPQHGHLTVQKYSLEDGSPLWGETPVTVTSGADLELSYFAPNPYLRIQEDENGGFGFAWRVPMNFGAIGTYQHFDKNGKPRFPGPIRFTHGDAGFNPSIPQMVVKGEDTYLVWSAQRVNDTGIFARKLDKEGNSVWGEEPTVIKPMFSYNYEGEFTSYSDINQLSLHDDHINLYFDKVFNFWPTTLNVLKLDFNGVVSDEHEVNSIKDAHSIAQMSRGKTGEDVLAWTDSGWGDGPLYVTNLKADRTSGVSEDISLNRNAKVIVATEDKAQTLTLAFADFMAEEHTVELVSTSDNLTISDIVIGEGTVTASFTPADNAHGEMTFELTVTDTLDTTRTVTKAYRMLVGAEYDAPEINLPEVARVKEQSLASINFSVSSAESDDLTIEWRQDAGPEVSFTTYNNALEFQAPEVTADTDYAFTISVDDGTQVTEQQIVVTVVKDVKPKDNSSGSFGWLLTGLAAIGLVRRSKKFSSNNKNA